MTYLCLLRRKNGQNLAAKNSHYQLCFRFSPMPILYLLDKLKDFHFEQKKQRNLNNCTMIVISTIVKLKELIVINFLNIMNQLSYKSFSEWSVSYPSNSIRIIILRTLRLECIQNAKDERNLTNRRFYIV